MQERIRGFIREKPFNTSRGGYRSLLGRKPKKGPGRKQGVRMRKTFKYKPGRKQKVIRENTFNYMQGRIQGFIRKKT